MLLIFTDYDQVSNVLNACALELSRRAKRQVKVRLGPPKSQAETIRELLVTYPEISLFYFGHGELPPSGLIGQDKIPAIHGKHLRLLKDRLVVAATCYSAQSLAAAVKRHGATVIGYRDEFLVSFRVKDKKLQAGCILAAALSLVGGGDAITARRELAEAFERAADRLITGNLEDAVVASLIYRGNAQGIHMAGKNRTM
jgi:hypothetical protein